MKKIITDIPHELAYFAALLDKSGLTKIYPKKADLGRYAVAVGVHIHDVRVVDWLQERVDGNYTRYTDKDGYVSIKWNLKLEQVAEILTALMPYSIIKKKIYENIIALRSTHTYNVATVTPEQITLRKKIYAEYLEEFELLSGNRTHKRLKNDKTKKQKLKRKKTTS